MRYSQAMDVIAMKLLQFPAYIHMYIHNGLELSDLFTDDQLHLDIRSAALVTGIHCANAHGDLLLQV